MKTTEIINQADALYYKGLYAESLQILNLLPTDGEGLADSDLISYHDLAGRLYYHLGQLTEAEKHYSQALHFAQSAADVERTYNSYDNLSSVYASMKRQREALELLQKSISLKEEMGHTEKLGSSYINVAGIHFALENFTSGKNALEKASHYLHHHKQDKLFRYLFFAQGMQLIRENKHAEAIAAYRKAIKFSKPFNDLLVNARALSNIASIYINQKKWTSAEKPATEALQICKANNIKIDTLSLTLTLAKVAFEKGNYNTAKELLQSVEKDIPAHGNSAMQKEMLELRARLYKQQGNYSEALHTYEQYLETYRSLYNEQQSQAVIEIQAKYENEKKERELQQAQLQRVESELRALRAQMNPHFVFNALSSIRKQMLKGDTETADDYIVRFSRLLRLILDSTRTPLVKLSDNITMLDLYMQIEQARQNNSFKYTIKVPASLRTGELFVPGMVLQPLIENAIIHGLFHKQGAKGKLTLTFAKAGTCLKVTVTDNGVGRDKAGKKENDNHNSHALNIVKETLALAWGNNAKKDYLQITDKKNKAGRAAGTSVQVLLPLHLKP